MKARLNERRIGLPKTHDLEHLLDLLAPVEPLWISLKARLKELTKFAVRVRYPGFSADRVTASKAFELCTEVRALARSSLGLKS